jgi:hypothetical protein
MEPTNADSTRRLLLWGAPIVGGHFLAVVWHLILVVKVQPNFPRPAVPLLILVNLLPIVGLVALAKQYRALAGILILVPLGIALVIGVYQHFVSLGTDNVFRMPPGDLTLPFQASAVLLAFLEVLGCWLGIKIFAARRNT